MDALVSLLGVGGLPVRDAILLVLIIGSLPLAPSAPKGSITAQSPAPDQRSSCTVVPSSHAARFAPLHCGQ